MNHLVAMTTQEERDSQTIDALVELAYSRLVGIDEGSLHKRNPAFSELSEDEQAQVRSAIRVFDLFCDSCGDQHRAFLPLDAESWTCDNCSTQPKDSK